MRYDNTRINYYRIFSILQYLYIYIYKQFKNRFPPKLFIEIKRLMQNIRKESKYDFVL